MIDQAQLINKVAKDNGAPVVSTPLTMGGYRYPILESIACGRDFQIVKAHVGASDQAEMHALVTDAETAYSYVDTSVLTVVQVDGWGSDECMADHGWTILAGQKTFKRAKTLNRPFRLWTEMSRPLCVYLVDDDDYTDSDNVRDLPSGLKERLLDGGFVLNPRLYDLCLDNVSFSSEVDEITTVDHIRAYEFRRQAANIGTFNARIFGEFHYLGENQIAHPGMIKGQAFLDVGGITDRIGADVICTRSALKREVYGKNTYVLLEPQTKKPHANGDNQSICHNPVLYEPRDVESFVKRYMYSRLEDIKNDKLLEQWYNLTSPAFNAGNERQYDQRDLINLTKWNARTWVMSGMRIVDSPWLFEQMAKNILSIINTKNDNKMRIPISCAIRCQVVSQSLASMAGCDYDVEAGQIRYSEELEVLVTSDDDWIEMYESHGGMDLDDFFVAYWRTIDNQRKIIIMRSPNDFGEYSIFDYVDPDWYPTEKMMHDEIISFPLVNHDESLWPKRLSEAVRDDEIRYLGLPSTRDEEVYHEGEYTFLDVFAAMENNVGAQTCVGANVNARSLWSISMRKHREVQLCPMEACIDTGAQGGHSSDIAAVTEEASIIVAQVVNDVDQSRIDRYTWQTRFEPYHGIPFDEDRLHDGHLTKIHDFRRRFAVQFMSEVSDFVSRHVATNVDERIHLLGRRFLGHGSDILLSSRRSVVQTQNANNDSVVNDWGDIHIDILSRIHGLKRVTDRHDLLMGVYSACLLIPTTTSAKLTDQLVMNPSVFEYLMEALRFYGIAAHLVINEHGHINRVTNECWSLTCCECDSNIIANSPIIVQSFHAQLDTCPTCFDSADQ